MSENRFSPQKLSQWFKTAIGKPFVHAELALLERASQRFFGAHCAISSVYNVNSLIPSIPCRRIYNLIPAEMAASDHDQPAGKPMVTDMSQLPFQDDTLEGFILVHTLDSVENPQDAIREVARVLRPGGQLILVGFNPSSLLGWARFIPGLRHKIPSQAHFVGLQRLYDWFSLLNFDVEYSGGSSLNPFKQQNFTLPETRKQLAQSSFWRAAKVGLSKTLKERFGGVYCLRLRKTYVSGSLVGRVEIDRKPIWGSVGNTAAISRESLNRSKRTKTPPADYQ